METIASRVIALRQSKHMTQQQLADAAGIKQPSLAYIESGRTKSLKGKTLNGLTKALDTTPDFLLYGSDPKDHENAMDEAELMSIWRRLAVQDRRTLLRTAHGLLATTKPQSLPLAPKETKTLTTV
jgi:transcriptional regulator with XRE-family HTH domain